ncbi:hypothetical protein [Propioniciclava sinopodophylli]|uniref:hypothetical protein n=1 Tax=Propioniciclava sinopodophylli TaxID=1837344 RepID=UPI00248FEA58|nr:hypothetical protein [Propioniciclava sinopodophylli]
MTTRLTRVGIAVAALATVSALPAAASMLVNHGRGPTIVHDSAYSDSRTQVHSWTRDGQTQVRLMVTGLPANRTVGAHVHTAPCGTDPLASGGHYQHSTDASQPLADRELWLDLTTDAEGRGTRGRVITP